MTNRVDNESSQTCEPMIDSLIDEVSEEKMKEVLENQKSQTPDQCSCHCWEDTKDLIPSFLAFCGEGKDHKPLMPGARSLSRMTDLAANEDIPLEALTEDAGLASLMNQNVFDRMSASERGELGDLLGRSDEMKEAVAGAVASRSDFAGDRAAAEAVAEKMLGEVNDRLTNTACMDIRRTADRAIDSAIENLDRPIEDPQARRVLLAASAWETSDADTIAGRLERLGVPADVAEDVAEDLAPYAQDREAMAKLVEGRPGEKNGLFSDGVFADADEALLHGLEETRGDLEALKTRLHNDEVDDDRILTDPLFAQARREVYSSEGYAGREGLQQLIERRTLEAKEADASEKHMIMAVRIGATVGTAGLGAAATVGTTLFDGSVGVTGAEHDVDMARAARTAGLADDGAVDDAETARASEYLGMAIGVAVRGGFWSHEDAAAKSFADWITNVTSSEVAGKAARGAGEVGWEYGRSKAIKSASDYGARRLN